MSRSARLVLVGVAGGLLSGLFGVGGGIVMVPLLIWLTGMDQRQASATSLLAIVPASAVGTTTYLAGSAVNLLAGVLIAVGGVAGAQLGSALLARLPLRVLRWLFVVLMLDVAFRTLTQTPSRGSEFLVHPLSGLGLVVLGVVMGVASGLFGIGGGTIAVPGMMLGFGVGDLLAKGTSLLAIIPTGISGSIANVRRGMATVHDGLLVGLPAAAASWVGARTAFALPARTAAVLFAGLMVVAAAQLARRALRDRPRVSEASGLDQEQNGE